MFSEKLEGGGGVEIFRLDILLCPCRSTPPHITTSSARADTYDHENVIAISYNKRSVYPGKNHSLAADGCQPKSAPIPIRTDLVGGIKNSTERIFAIISLYYIHSHIELRVTIHIEMEKTRKMAGALA